MKSNITMAVLALQGAFAEQEQMLRKLGVQVIELRQKTDLNHSIDGFILPGGESTVQGKLLREEGMLTELRRKIQEGTPVLATCAGLILLAQEVEGQQDAYLGTLPVTVKRNAYGRQLGSFSMEGAVQGISQIPYPMEFIRAPYITKVQEGVQILARDTAGHIVGVRHENQFAFAFHPELTRDFRIHEMFLKQCEKM